jgi:hypothetical protein
MDIFYYAIAIGYDNIPVIEQKVWVKVIELKEQLNKEKVVILTSRTSPEICSRVTESKKASKLKVNTIPSSNYSKYLSYQRILKNSVVFIDNVSKEIIKELQEFIESAVFVSYNDEQKLIDWVNTVNAKEVKI